MPIAESAPIAGVCFTIGALVQLAVLGVWIARRRPRTPLWIWVSISTAVLGAIAVWFGGGLAQRTGFADWTAWSTPILAAVLIAAIAAALQLLLSRTTTTAAADPRREDAPARAADAGSRHDALGSLAGEERRAVLADRDAALAVLEQRGMLSPDLAERARRAPLGSLHELDAH